MAVQRRVYLGTRKFASLVGLSSVWATAANWYVWGRPAIDPGSGKRLFQIVGVPRAGTTLLAKLVMAHPEVYCIIEPYRGFYTHGCCIDEGNLIDHHPNRELSRIMQMRAEACVGIKETFYANYHPADHRNERFFDRMCDLGVITIAIHRDPRDTYASVREFANHSGGVPLRELCSWRKFVRWSESHADLAVKYESLVVEPESTMLRVLTALGLTSEGYRAIPEPTADPTALRLGDPRALKSRSVDSSSVGTYATRLSSDAIAFIEQECRAEMALLDYL